MKKEELPQDPSALGDISKELLYVKSEDGKYQTGLSIGWDVKKIALDNAWEEIEELKSDALEAIKKEEKSPVLYFMHLNLMDLPILSGYTKFSKFTIKRHLKPKVFKKLSNNKLQKYADTFNVSIDELKNFKA